MIIKKLFVISFFILISCPILLIPANDIIEIDPQVENRAKAKFPSFTSEFPFKVILETEDYVKDNFAFRIHLSKLYIFIKFNIFNGNPLPDKVVSGKEGWLFLGNSNEFVFNDAIGLQDLEPEEIIHISNQALIMKDFCESLGIKFYFAVASNKHTFYQEYLPLTPNKKLRRFEQVSTNLKNNGMEIIDLKKNLLPKKDSLRLYHKTDTHWNEFGAFYATQQLVREIRKDFPILDLNLSDFDVNTVISNQMDLSRMLNSNIQEQHYKFTYIGEIDHPQIDTIPVSNERDDYYLKTFNKQGKYKAVVFRDSFFTYMFDYFPYLVGEVNIVWSSVLDKQVILKEKPDFVVFEVIERNLGIIGVKD